MPMYILAITSWKELTQNLRNSKVDNIYVITGVRVAVGAIELITLEA